ncbi:MAG: hypothetical protein DME19_13690 [Verrucomicrobia bacterium]|nr:MAG: hypothetical protein DME19_13690 [Verrucomicrobiota bacterium]
MQGLLIECEWHQAGVGQNRLVCPGLLPQVQPGQGQDVGLIGQRDDVVDGKSQRGQPGEIAK